MRGVKRLGWVTLTLMTAAAFPCTGRAADKADKSLEDRVRALERKLDQEQQGTATEQKTVTDRINAIEKEVKGEHAGPGKQTRRLRTGTASRVAGAGFEPATFGL